MKFEEPNYSEYTLEELYQVLDNIDLKYKDRIKRVEATIAQIERSPSTQEKDLIENRIKELNFRKREEKNWKGALVTVMYFVIYPLVAIYTGVFYIEHESIKYSEEPYWFIAFVLFYFAIAVHMIFVAYDRWTHSNNSQDD